MEKDDEVKGDGLSYTTHFRQLDPRVGRWLTIDPVYKEFQSPYISMSDNPISRVDPNGDDDYFDSDGNFLFSTGFGDEVRIINKDVNGFGLLFDAQDLFANVAENACVEELITHHLRNSNQTKNLTEAKFKSTTPLTKIFTVLGGKYLDNGEKIYATDNAKLAGGIMSTSQSKKLVDGTGNKPKIYATLTGRYSGGFIVDEALETVANIENTIVHEVFHQDNHFVEENNGLYRGLGVERDHVDPSSGDVAVIRHLDAYIHQINHSTWKDTTDEFKRLTVRVVKKYLKQIENVDDYKKQKERFKDRLGDLFTNTTD